MRFNKIVRIGNREVGHSRPIFIIAEAGVNHFGSFKKAVRLVEEALGKYEKKPTESEAESKKWARKSLVAKMNISAGTIITGEMLCSKRPGTGISPELINKVIGKKTNKIIKADSMIKWEDIS